MIGKSKYLITSLIFVLALLISVAGISVPVKQSNANGMSELSLVITSPANNSQIPYCTNFTVSANVTSPYPMGNLEVTIGISGNAALVSGDIDGTPATYSYNLPQGGTVTPDWELHCEGIGDVTITISAGGWIRGLLWMVK